MKNPKGAKGDVAIPDVVAKVNGVEIKSGPIKFQLSNAMRKQQRNFSPAEKRKIVSSLVDKEIVRELVHQEGKAKKGKSRRGIRGKRIPGCYKALRQ